MKCYFIGTMLLISVATASAAASRAIDFFGATIADRDVPTLAWRVGITGMRPVVDNVTFDSPAAKYGLKRGDIILSVNNKEVRSAVELDQFTADILTVCVLSDNENRKLRIDRLAIEAARAKVITAKRETPPDGTHKNLSVHERHDSSAPSEHNDTAPKNKPELKTTPLEGTPASEKSATTPAQTGYGDIVDELVELAGHRREMNDVFGRSGRSEFEQFMSEIYSPELAENTLKRVIARRLDRQQQSAVLAWYKSPTGKKVVEAESIWDFNGKTNALIYASNESAPGFKERMNLIRQIERESGATDTEMKLIKRIIDKMIKAIPPDFPDGKNIKKRMESEIPTLEEKRKEITRRLAYTCRDLTLAELGDYLKFLHSASGRKYTAALKEATEEIFKKVAVNIENDFRKDIKKLMP